MGQGSGVRDRGAGIGEDSDAKKLSRFRSLAKSNGFSGDVLSDDEEVSEERDLWACQSVTTCGCIGAGKYC